MSSRVLNQQKAGRSSNKSAETARLLGLSSIEMTVIATAMLNNNDRDPVNLGKKARMKQNRTIPKSPIQKLRILKHRK